VSKNILIVESENDKYFFQALVDDLQSDIESVEAVCNIDEYECLGGISKLEPKLIALKRRISKDDISKIGIIFDADAVGIKKRTEDIKKLTDEILSDISDLEIEVYILNVDGAGDLETLLKTIKSEDSLHADCLDGWRECLDSNDKKVTDKEFDKFWVSIYQRYDCCDKKEKKQAGSKCNNEASYKKPIWDFNHPALEELKKFLTTFSTPSQ